MNEENTLEHVGVLGMKWGHRKSGSGDSAERSNARMEAKRLVKEREVVRSQRSRGTKIGDWFLNTHYSNKTYSETHGNTEAARKGSELSNKIEDLRRKRTRGEKVVDALMTPYRSKEKFTEMDPSKRRKVVALTAAVLAVQIGAMVYDSRKYS